MPDEEIDRATGHQIIQWAMFDVLNHEGDQPTQTDALGKLCHADEYICRCRREDYAKEQQKVQPIHP